MLRKAIGAGAALLLAGGVVAALAFWLAPASSQSVDDPRLPPATAAVTRATLVDTKTVTGTLGFGDLTPVRAAGAGVLTSLPAERSTVERGGRLFALDGVPVTVLYGETPFFRTLQFDAESFDTFAWVELEDASADLREAELNLELERDRLAEAESQLTDATARLDDAARDEPRTPEFIQLKGAVGIAEAVVERTRSLSETGARPPVDLETAEGDLATARANLAAVVSELGQQIISAETDLAAARLAVAQAERALAEAREWLEALQSRADYRADAELLMGNLAALGYTGPAAEAVRAWQSDLGLAANGIVEPGQLVITPGPVRIAEQIADIGDAFGDGSPEQEDVLSYSGTSKLVTVSLGVADQSFAVPGRDVTITLPDDRELRGVISEVGAVVTEQGEVEVLVAIPDQAALGTLEATSVDVEFVREERESVLSVPIAALLARPEGGFGVEIVEGTSSRIVPVRTGLFAGGRVEIDGEGIAEGVLVGVPG